MTYKKYTLEPGRSIYKDGKPFAYIGNDEGVPAELDTFAHNVVNLMNAAERLVEDDDVYLTGTDLKNIFGPSEDCDSQEEDYPGLMIEEGYCEEKHGKENN